MAETTAFAFESLITKEEPQSLTKKIFESAEKAFLTIEGDMRYRYDGGDPTADIGHLLKDGSYLTLIGSCQIQSFRFIKTGYGSANLFISYERI